MGNKYRHFILFIPVIEDTGNKSESENIVLIEEDGNEKPDFIICPRTIMSLRRAQ